MLRWLLGYPCNSCDWGACRRHQLQNRIFMVFQDTRRPTTEHQISDYIWPWSTYRYFRGVLKGYKPIWNEDGSLA